MEGAQAAVISSGKLLSDGEGYTLDKEMKNVMAETWEAFQSMLLISAGSAGARSYGGVSVPLDSDKLSQADAIEETIPGLTKEEAQKVSLDNLDTEGYKAAEDKDAYLEEQGLNEQERDLLHKTQDIQEEELSEKSEKVEASQTEETEQHGEFSEEKVKKSAGEELRLATSRHGKFIDIKEENGGLRFTTKSGFDMFLELSKMPEITNENGEVMDVKAFFDPSVATIHLGENLDAEDISSKFLHEWFHGVEDLLLTQGEMGSLEKIAMDSLPAKIQKSIKENYAGANASLMRSETIAHAFEYWDKTGNMPVDARKLYQKMIDMIKDMLAKYIGTSESGMKVLNDIQSGKIAQRKPRKSAVKHMAKAANRRKEAREDEAAQSELSFIREGLSEQDANNKELVTAIQALSKLSALPSFLSEKPSTKDQIEQSTGFVSTSEKMGPEDMITGDELLESELPGDFSQREEDGAGVDPEALQAAPQTMRHPILKFIEDNGGIAMTNEIKQEIINRHGDLKATKRYVNKNGALDWDQMARLLSTEPSSPLYNQEVDKDDILNLVGESSEIKFSLAPPTDSPAFKKWSDDAEIIEGYEIYDHDFKANDPIIMKLYHGTTHADKLFEFKGEEKGNKEGHFGAINYFTNMEYDAEQNYLTDGPDLTNRIERRAEQLENNDDMEESEAKEQARNELKGTSPEVLELYVRVDNPIVIGGPQETFVDIIGEEDLSEFIDEAKAQLAEDQEVDESELDDSEVNDAARELFFENGYEIEQDTPMMDAIDTVARRYDFSAEELFEGVQEFYEGAKSGDIDRSIPIY